MKESTKRRKSKAQIKEEKRIEERKQNEIARKLAEYDQIKSKADEVDRIQAEKEQLRLLCQGLYEDGVIK